MSSDGAAKCCLKLLEMSLINQEIITPNSSIGLKTMKNTPCMTVNVAGVNEEKAYRHCQAGSKSHNKTSLKKKKKSESEPYQEGNDSAAEIQNKPQGLLSISH